jgi:DNA anti-recombination protein RmuC
MTTNEIIDALYRQKHQIEEHLDDLLARCSTEWNDAVNQPLRTNDAQLGTLVSDLTTIQDNITTMIARADDLGTIINTIAKGIGIGAKILTLAK